MDKKKDMDKEDKDMDKEDKDKEDKDKDKEEAKSELDRELWRSLPGWLAYNGGRTTPVYWGDFGLAALANTIPPSPYWFLDPSCVQWPFNKNCHCPHGPVCQNDCNPLRAVLSRQGQTA